MDDETITLTWCPRCGQADLGGTTCPRCGLGIRTATADELRRLSKEIEERRHVVAALATQQHAVMQEYDGLVREYQRVLAEAVGPVDTTDSVETAAVRTATFSQPAPKAEFRPERVRDILLWIGVALLAAAAVTFAAVAWTRYGAWGKGAILFGATTVSGVVAHRLRRTLYATAEAVAALALVFALADWWGARQVGLGTTWSGSTASTIGSLLIATFASVLFVWSRLRVYRAGAILASLSLIGSLIALVPSRPTEITALLFSCAAALVALSMAWPQLRAPFETRLLLLIGAGIFWLIALGGVLVSLGHDGPFVVIAAAALALAPISMRLSWHDDLDDAGGQFFIGVAAFFLMLVPAVALRHFDVTTAILATVLAAAVLIALAAAAPLLLREGSGRAGLAGATLSALALTPGVLSATFGPLVRSRVFQGQASDSLRSLVSLWASINPATLASVAVIAVTAWALTRGTLRSSFPWLELPMVRIAVVSTTCLVPLALVYADVTVAVALGVNLAVVVAGTLGFAVLDGRGRRRYSFLAALPGITVAASAIGLALTTRPMAVTGTGILTVALLAVTMISRSANTRFASAVAGGAGVWATIALALPLTGISDFSAHVVLTGVAVMILVAGSSLRTNQPDGVGFEICGGVLTAVSLLMAGVDTQALAIASLLGAAGAAIVALRPERRVVGTVASTALVLIALWSELAAHEVRTVEAYSVPLAIALIGLGFWWRRTHREIADSWTAYGTGLAIGLLPTVSVGIGNDDTTRLILGAGAAAAVLFVGARARLRAPVVIAASVLAVLAGDQIVDVATQIPRWVTFAVLGAVCVGLGATADRQLDRVRRVRHTLHSMQ